MSTVRLFGTDGIRGVANVELTALMALKLGMAVGHWVCNDPLNPENSGYDPLPPNNGGTLLDSPIIGGQRVNKNIVIIGRDTRVSGDMLEAAIAAGLAAMGVDVLNVGVVPTPAVSQIVLAERASAGIVISASHNPFEDNGIKFFGRNGKKLPDRIEDNIEANISHLEDLKLPIGADIGRIVESREPVQHYIDSVISSLGHTGQKPLKHLHLVVDCANGAIFELGPRILTALGAKITLLHNEPNGVNINVECGSTRPRSMSDMVKATGASAGLAFDGDADRVLLADENGRMVDGDQMMAIIALHMQSLGQLSGDVVVSTIMSNVGLEKALEARSIKLHRTDVGDRYVAEAMDELGAAIGGEQSGHILLPNLTPTGDGLVTALQILAVMEETGKPLSELAGVVVHGPQLLKNVKVRNKQGWHEDSYIQDAIESGKSRLGNPLWLSVRASGTEPLIRVMAQDTDEALVHSVVNDICAVVEMRLCAVDNSEEAVA